jgi:hypothetical protein
MADQLSEWALRAVMVTLTAALLAAYYFLFHGFHRDAASSRQQSPAPAAEAMNETENSAPREVRPW